jgi:hypothetical protein
MAREFSICGCEYTRPMSASGTSGTSGSGEGSVQIGFLLYWHVLLHVLQNVYSILSDTPFVSLYGRRRKEVSTQASNLIESWRSCRSEHRLEQWDPKPSYTNESHPRNSALCPFAELLPDSLSFRFPWPSLVSVYSLVLSKYKIQLLRI